MGVACHICGLPIKTMVMDPEELEDAYVALKGQWVWFRELDAAVFILDPDSELTIVTLPGNRLGIVPDEDGKPTTHHHTECYQRMVQVEDLEWDEFDIVERIG